jgi:hypothetical protein
MLNSGAYSPEHRQALDDRNRGSLAKLNLGPGTCRNEATTLLTPIVGVIVMLRWQF